MGPEPVASDRVASGLAPLDAAESSRVESSGRNWFRWNGERRAQVPGLPVRGIDAAAKQSVVVWTGLNGSAGQIEGTGRGGAATRRVDHEDAVAGGDRAAAAEHS